MGKFQDLTGKKFGRLTVIERDKARKGTWWKCVCDCGAEKYAPSVRLTNGQTQSCGCFQKELAAERYTKNEVGKRYGKLVVLELIRRPKPDGNGNSVYFRCKCDCGESAEVWGAHLRAGNIYQCSKCKAQQTADTKFINETGNRYGKLLVLKEDKRDRFGERMWLCQCDCGNLTSVRISALRGRQTVSCGCHMLVSNYKHGLSYTKEYQTALSHKRKEMANELDSEWTVEMQIVLDEFQTKCTVCGMTLKEHLNKYGKSLSTDHVIPLSKGGGLKPGNAVKMCVSCNSMKHDKMLSELPLEWQANIIWNAFAFKNHWDSRELEYREISSNG